MTKYHLPEGNDLPVCSYDFLHSSQYRQPYLPYWKSQLLGIIRHIHGNYILEQFRCRRPREFCFLKNIEILVHSQKISESVIPIAVCTVNDKSSETVIFTVVGLFPYLDVSHFTTPVAKDNKEKRELSPNYRMGHITPFSTAFYTVYRFFLHDIPSFSCFHLEYLSRAYSFVYKLNSL